MSLKRPLHSFAISDEDFDAAVALAKELGSVKPHPRYKDLVKTIKDNLNLTLLDAKSVVDTAIGEIEPS